MFTVAALGLFCWSSVACGLRCARNSGPRPRHDRDVETRIVQTPTATTSSCRACYVYRVGGESTSEAMAFRRRVVPPRGCCGALEGVTASKQHRVYFHPKHADDRNLPRTLAQVVAFLLHSTEEGVCRKSAKQKWSFSRRMASSSPSWRCRAAAAARGAEVVVVSPEKVRFAAGRTRTGRERHRRQSARRGERG